MDFINQVFDVVQQQYVAYGYLIVFLAAFLKNTIGIGLVIPGGSLVLLGTVYASNDVLSLPLVILLGWLGVFLGCCFDYWIGRLGIYNTIEKTFLKRYLDTHMETAAKFLAEKGALAISLSFFVGYLRSFVAVTAGTVKFPFGKYMLYQAPASFVWNLIYCLAGFFLAKTVNNLESVIIYVLLLMSALAFASYGGYALLQRLKSTPTVTPSEEVE